MTYLSHLWPCMYKQYPPIIIPRVVGYPCHLECYAEVLKWDKHIILRLRQHLEL